MLESALLDLTPDEALAMNNQRRMLRWDAKKRKFVKVEIYLHYYFITIISISDIYFYLCQQTLEEFSQGKGAKRVRTESGVVGKKSNLPAGEMYAKWMKKTHREIGGFEDEGDSKRPNVKVNRKVPDELKNAQQLKKLREVKDNNALKNMAKDKRRKIEKKNKEKKQKAQNDAKKFTRTKGSGKVRCIVRV